VSNVLAGIALQLVSYFFAAPFPGSKKGVKADPPSTVFLVESKFCSFSNTGKFTRQQIVNRRAN
jgi:hypothetical protein